MLYNLYQTFVKIAFNPQVNWNLTRLIKINSIFSDTTTMDVQTKEVIVGIVTDIDLLHYVSKKENENEGSVEDNDK